MYVRGASAPNRTRHSCREVAGLAAALVLFFISAPAAEVVDCLVAVVNGQPVTLTEVRIVDAFGFYRKEVGESAGDRLFRTLEKIVDRKTVIQFAGGNVSIPEAEIQSALRSLLDELGPDAVQEKLERFDLDLDDVMRILEEKLIFQRIIELRFSRSVTVSLQEMEAYYQRVYASGQTRKELQPEPMIAMLQEIEARIRREKIDAQAVLWIKNLRGQAEVEFRYDWLRQISRNQE
ncbi:MAG: hypothetical protein MUQ00_05330 [Candidatus Aminicenantes bacterium]|nr:hypothetical protein [Candidatus Aminicenantes bacterium]